NPGENRIAIAQLRFSSLGLIDTVRAGRVNQGLEGLGPGDQYWSFRRFVGRSRRDHEPRHHQQRASHGYSSKKRVLSDLASGVTADLGSHVGGRVRPGSLKTARATGSSLPLGANRLLRTTGPCKHLTYRKNGYRQG